MPEDLQQVVEPELLERLRQAGMEAAGQRRNVTVLFVDLADYTGLSTRLDGEDLYHIIQKYIRTLVEDVHKYEGTVDKIIGDAVMAIFGAPVMLENSAEQALRAAVDMQADLARLNRELLREYQVELKAHIGLNAGSVIVGGVGSDKLMDYTVIGDTVNLASRLEAASTPGRILVSESVFHHTKALFDFEAVKDLEIKGLNEPVQAYYVLGEKAAPGSLRGLEGLRSRMVGREQELDTAKNYLTRLVEEKQGCLVIVSGEAGIGKSRLTTEFKLHCSQQDLLIMEGQSLTYRKAVSYWIFQDLLRNYLKIRQDTTAQEVKQKLDAQARLVLGPAANEVLPFLYHLFAIDHLDPSSASRLAYLDPSQMRQQIFLAVRDLLTAEAQRQPLVLVLEDLHWADDASLDLTVFLANSIPQSPIYIFAITRPFQDGPLTQLVSQAENRFPQSFAWFKLQQLSDGQSENLLLELLNIPELPAALREQILQRSGGNPLYLEEILRMLIEGQVIYQEAGRWTIHAGAEKRLQNVPQTLQGLILARLDRLSPHQKKVLQVASIIGRKFSAHLLGEVLINLTDAELKTILELLEERDFIYSQPLADEKEYAFRHILTSDAVYSTLLRQDRNELHGLVADAIERYHAGHLESQIEVLAGHYLRSPRQDKALHYLLLAGQKAARDYANPQSRRHYEEALEILPKVKHSFEQEIQVGSGLGDILVFVGEYSAARDRFVAVISSVGPTEKRLYAQEVAALSRKIANTYERQGDYDHSLQTLETALQQLEISPLPAPVEHARILNDTGWIYFLRGNFDEATQKLIAALDLVLITRQYDVIASIYNRLGAVAYHQSSYQRAVEYVRKSLALRETIGDRSGVARLYNNLGLLGLMRGDLRDARANFLQSIDLLEKIGDAEGITLAYSNLGLTQLDQGDFAQAEVNLLRSLATAEQIGHRFYRGQALVYLGRLYTNTRKFQEAETRLLESRKLFLELGAQDNVVDSSFYLAENSFSRRDLPSAQTWLDCVQQSLEESGTVKNSLQYGRCQRLLGSLARAAGNFQQAQEHLLTSRKIFDSSSERLESARTVFELGLLALDVNDQISAEQNFAEARKTFLDVGAQFDLQKIEEIH